MQESSTTTTKTSIYARARRGQVCVTARWWNMRVDTVEFVMGAVGVDTAPDDGLPEIAFAGRSNVGKSSLINRLVQRKSLARTSSTPGKTQQLNYYLVNERLYLVDLPGYGFVHGGQDLRRSLGKLTDGYLQKRTQLRAVVQLIDARHGPSDLDLHLEAVGQLDRAGALISPIQDRLQSQALEALGEPWLMTWREGLPHWKDTPGGINLSVLLWLHNLIEAWDLESYATARYGILGHAGHWAPGANADALDQAVSETDLRAVLNQSPWAETIPGLLRDLKERVGGVPQERLSSA